MRKVDPQYIPMTAALMVIVLLVSITGCERQATVAASPTVNSTFVDVDGLRQAPGKAISVRSTQDLHLGASVGAGPPALVNDAMYALTTAKDGSTWMTKWHLATGTKGWSVPVSPVPWTASLSCADGNIFFAGNSMGYHNAVACMDDGSGALRWNNLLSAATGNGNDTVLSAVVPIAGRDHTLNTDQICAVVSDVTPLALTNDSGIWVWNATGILAAKIVYPTLRYTSPTTMPVPLLYDGVTIYAALPVTVPHDRTVITTDRKDDCTDIVAVSAATHRVRVLKSFCGSIRQLIKQDDRLIMLRENMDGTTTIDVLTPGTWAYDVTETSCVGGRRWTSIAADSARIYAAGDGTLTSFSTASLNKLWTVQFKPYTSRGADHADGGELVDFYLTITLTVTRNVLYVQDGGGLLLGVDPASGRNLWEKRISWVLWYWDHTDSLFLLQPVERGFRTILSNGTVSTWRQ